jgi:small basic protein
MRILLDRDFLAALVLFAIGGVFLSSAGTDVTDWAFPRLAAYLVLAIAVVLAARTIFGSIFKHKPDLLEFDSEHRVVVMDVLVFLAVVLVYLFVMYGLGFWLASFLMLTATTVYLTLDKTRYNLALAVGVPLGICIVAYFVFQHVFYVPVPDARWW